MKIFSLVLIFIILGLFLGSSYAYQEEEKVISFPKYTTQTWDEVYEPMKVEQTISIIPEPEIEKPIFPNEEQLKLIGRLSKGIFKLKKRKYPYECGVRLDDDKLKENALTWAYHVVKASWEASDEGDELNVWGLAGTISIESKFDLCTFGLYPRKAAYRTKYKGKPILKPSRVSISHTYEDVVKAIYNPKLKRQFAAYDLGALQVLDKYYQGKPEFLMTREGFYWQVNWMMQKQRRHKTKRPWAYWPGYFAQWKHDKVVRHARKLGATPQDLPK